MLRINFYRAAACRRLATRKLSVRLSVKRVIYDKMKETCANILIPYERLFTLVL